jgi:hypothetical protein
MAGIKKKNIGGGSSKSYVDPQADSDVDTDLPF